MTDLGDVLRDKMIEISDPKYRHRIKTLCSLMNLKFDMERDLFVSSFVNEVKFPSDSIFQLRKDDILELLKALREECTAQIEGTIGRLEEILKED